MILTWITCERRRYGTLIFVVLAYSKDFYRMCRYFCFEVFLLFWCIYISFDLYFYSFPSIAYACVVVKNWSSVRCCHVPKQLSSLFEVYAIINYLWHIRPSREHPQFRKSLQAKSTSISKAPSLRAISEQTPVLEASPLESPKVQHPRLHLKSSIITAEIFTCNHAASPLPCWRHVMLIHSRWTVKKFFACNLNHHVRNYNRYNKFAHEDHAISQISWMPQLPQDVRFSINRPSPARRGLLRSIQS